MDSTNPPIEEDHVATDQAPSLEAPSRSAGVTDALAATKASTLDLAKRLAEHGNAAIDTLEPAERIAAVRDLLIAFVTRVASAAKSSVDHLRILLIVMAAVGLASAIHLWFVRDHSAFVAVLPIVILIVPFGCVLLCYRVLRSVADLPSHLYECADELIDSCKDYWSEIATLELKNLGLIRKWKTYFLLARILRRALSTTDRGRSILARLGLTALAANPLAWAFLAASIFVAILATALVCVVVALDFAIGLAF